MSNNAPNFILRCLAGEVAPSAIDDAVEAWHGGADDCDLPAYLGMSDDEYWRWVKNPAALADILAERKAGGLAA